MQQATRNKRRLVTTNYIIAELVALLDARLHLPRKQIFRAIDPLKANPHITVIHIDEATDAAAWDLLKQRQDKAWSLVDASSFVVMGRLGLTEAVTTDHHFEQAGFARLPSQA